MFGNLIESNSHRGDNRRKGSFFLGTLAVYALAFLLIGVGSIYAYNTSVENPDLRLVALVTPVDPTEVVVQERSVSRPASGHQTDSRPMIVSSPPQITTMDPTFVNENTRVAKSGVPELPPGTVYEVGNPSGEQNRFGTGRGNGTGGTGTGGNSTGTEELGRDTPPPAMTVESKPPTPKIKRSSGPLNGQATYLPKPLYTQIAKAGRASGLVTVEILIDESGKVISAHAVKGNPLLLAESVRAAYQAKFSPTTLGGVPVKVSGIITYNFVLQ